MLISHVHSDAGETFLDRSRGPSVAGNRGSDDFKGHILRRGRGEDWDEFVEFVHTSRPAVDYEQRNDPDTHCCLWLRVNKVDVDA